MYCVDILLTYTAQAVQELVFGEHWEGHDRCCTAHTPGATAALRLVRCDSGEIVQMIARPN